MIRKQSSTQAAVCFRRRSIASPPGLVLGVLIAAGWLSPASGWAAETGKMFRAGAFAADITPEKLPISVNGSMVDRQATEVHDRIGARCLVLDDGTTRVAIVVCDSCAIPRELFDKAKQRAHEATGIPTNHMLMSATHTHYAPTLVAVFQSEPDAEYGEFLIGKIVAGIRKATANLVPARVGWAVGKEPTQVFNRRWKMKPGGIKADPFGNLTDKARMNPGFANPDLVEPVGPIDPDISILSLQSTEGRPIAVLANYSLHYVGGIPGNMISASYFGVFCRRLTELLEAGNGDPPFVAMMSNGTSGDINNCNYSTGKPVYLPFARNLIVGESVAHAAHAAYTRIKCQDRVPLAMAEREIDLGVRLPSKSDVEKAKALLAKAKGTVLRGRPEVYARETILLSEYPPNVRIKLQAVRIGSLGIVGIPCEVFAEIGLAIKENSPLKTTFTIQLANGYNGYLPTPGQHALGGYETWRARSSYLETEASNKIYATLMQLLAEVAR